jgi:xanthine dehydrogenase accessory factor
MSILSRLAECERKGEAVVLCTVIDTTGSIPRHTGSKMLVFPDGKIEGTIGGGDMENRVVQEALQTLAEGKSRLLNYRYVDPQQGDPGICGGTMQVYVEPFLPKPTVVVIGGGHVGQAVTHLAKWLGFHVAVNDDRPEFCTPEVHPDADDFFPVPMSELPQKMNINAQTFLVLTTRGMPIDLPGVPVLLETPAAYIGIIGSKRRWILTKKALQEAGVPEEKLNRIHAPIGLELNAETPEEIAVSIMAEILMLRNGGSGASMKF